MSVTAASLKQTIRTERGYKSQVPKRGVPILSNLNAMLSVTLLRETFITPLFSLSLEYWHFNMKRLKLLSSEIFIMQMFWQQFTIFQVVSFFRQDCIFHLVCKYNFHKE